MKKPSSRLTASDSLSRYMTSGHTQVATTSTLNAANTASWYALGRWLRSSAATAMQAVISPLAATLAMTTLVGFGSFTTLLRGSAPC